MTNHSTASLFDDGADRDFNLVAVLRARQAQQQGTAGLSAAGGADRTQAPAIATMAGLCVTVRPSGRRELEPLRTRLCSIQRQMAALIDQLLSEPKPVRRLDPCSARSCGICSRTCSNALPYDEALATLRRKYRDDSGERLRQSERDLAADLPEAGTR